MSKLEEVVKSLVEQGINIDVKIAILKTLDTNKNLINSSVVNPKYRFIEFKILLEIQIREYCIIQICSFIDEYNKYFVRNYIEDHHSKKISDLRKFLKPFFHEINREYNLKDYRNHILAHNNRSNSESILMGNIKKKYNFPKYTEEFLAIKIIIDLILKIIIHEFRTDLNENLFEDKVILSGKIELNRNKKNFNLDKIFALFQSVK